MSNIQIDTTTEKDAVRIVLSAHAGTLNTAIHMFRAICKHNPVATVQLETTVETACEDIIQRMLEDNAVPAAEVKVAAGVSTSTAAPAQSADAQSFRDSITEISRQILVAAHISHDYEILDSITIGTNIGRMISCINHFPTDRIVDYVNAPDGGLLKTMIHGAEEKAATQYSEHIGAFALHHLLAIYNATDPIRNIPAFSMAIMNRIVNLLVRKNHDYGNSFGDQLAEDGPIVFKVRMKDKISRLRTLLTADAQVKDESIEDTLRDIIGYCILFLHHTAN